MSEVPSSENNPDMENNFPQPVADPSNSAMTDTSTSSSTPDPTATSTAFSTQPVATNPMSTANSAINSQTVNNFFATLLGSLKQIWYGTASQNFHRAAQTKYGFLTLGVYTFELALLLSVLIGRGFGAADALTSFSRSFGGHRAQSFYFVIGFGTWFGIFLISLIAFAAILALRILTLRIVFATRNKPISFTYLSGLYAQTLSPLIFLLPIVFLFMLLPAPTINALFLPMFLFIFCMCTFLAEILTYILINREGRFEKSPLVPYVASFSLWNVLNTIVLFILSTTIAAIIFAAASSYVRNMPW